MNQQEVVQISLEKLLVRSAVKLGINLNKKYTFVWFAAMGERFNATSDSVSNV